MPFYFVLSMVFFFIIASSGVILFFAGLSAFQKTRKVESMAFDVKRTSRP